MPRALSQNVRTVHTVLHNGVTALATHRCPGISPAREAEDLLAWAADVTRESLFAHPESRVSATALKKFRDAVRRRLAHEPIEYIIGSAQFMGRDFRVTRATLIPRPATETLVEEVIMAARNETDPAFVDVGTGSGAIAITLAAAFPAARVLGTDLSAPALAVARGNATRAGVAERTAFIRADLLPPTLPQRTGATVIVANLPYLPARTYAKLAPEVRLYEPRTALIGTRLPNGQGGDGLAPTKRLIDRLATERFHGRIHIFFELLPGQCARVIAYAARRLTHCAGTRIHNAQGTAIGVRLSSRT